MENLKKNLNENEYQQGEMIEQKVLSLINKELTGPSYPVDVQTRLQKAFYLAKTGKAIMYPTFFYLVNETENPKEFFKNPYSDKSEIDLNQQDEDGNTLLHYLAISAYFVPFSEYLITKGAKADILNKKEEPAIKFNAHQLNGYAIPLIEQTDKKFLNRVYSDGETILTDFFQKGVTCHLFDVAYALIKQGANINLTNKAGKTPLSYLFDRIKKYETGTKGYENLKYAIQELSGFGARVLTPKKVSASKNLKKNTKDMIISRKREL